jgi:hypothetical protein
MLDHPEAAIREKTVQGLAALGDPAAADAIRAHAAREPDAYLAAQAEAVADALARGS